MAADRGGLQSTDRMLAPAVAETLEKLELADEDAALSRLARSYAEQIDRAAGAAAHADRVLQAAFAQNAEPDIIEAIQLLRSKLAERAAVSDLGPKLLAVLDALGASPKARAAHGKGGAPSGPSKLAQLRANRAG